jgi:DNA polymerase-3 subunit delta'
MPFRDLKGHRRLIELLARSISRDTLPPSLILAGPAGVGKRLVATATAQALNCLSLVRGSSDLELDACGKCAACTRIARGVHPDVLVVQPGDTGSIKVDQVRELIDATAYRPFEGRRRVVIIDEADALVVPAQHALLKTLEEPPPSSIFLLVTSRPDALLPTVQSRCPRLRFQALSTDEVTSVLVSEGRPERDARAVAAIANGSVGAALSASVDEFAEARETAVRILAQTAAGPDAARRSAISQSLAGPAGTSALDRDGLATVLRAMSSLLRDVAALDTGATEGALANPDLASALGRLSTYRGERGVRAFSTLDEALVALDRNASVKIVADWVAVQL